MKRKSDIHTSSSEADRGAPGNAMDRLFHPRGIAVIGASDEYAKGSSMFLHSLIGLGYPGGLYPVNLSAGDKVMGLRAYKRVTDIPGPVDYAIVGVPATATADVVRDCIQKGVPYIHFFTAGFKELQTEHGERLERELVALARGKTRLIGPNCMGVYCPEARVGFDPNHTTQSGDVAFISQSGGHAINFIRCATERGLRLSKAISYGNASDLTASDFLQYFANDPATRTIGIYIEGAREGRLFFETLTDAARNKPVIIWKGGRTPAGTHAAIGHTGALAGSFEIWKGMLKQAGALLVDDSEEMIDLMLGLKYLTPPQGLRAALVTTGGGNSVIASDQCYELGLSMPPLETHTQQRLLSVLREAGTIRRNPVDASAHGIVPQNIEKIIEIIDNDPNIDCILFTYQLYFLFRNLKRIGVSLEEALEFLVGALKNVKANSTKPVAFALTRDSDELDAEHFRLTLKQRLLEVGMPAFDSVKAACLTLSRMNDLRKIRERINR
ncbi:MAG: CoA-binding protein [Candidatus Abyssubacteria bacterium]